VTVNGVCRFAKLTSSHSDAMNPLIKSVGICSRLPEEAVAEPIGLFARSQLLPIGNVGPSMAHSWEKSCSPKKGGGQGCFTGWRSMARSWRKGCSPVQMRNLAPTLAGLRAASFGQERSNGNCSGTKLGRHAGRTTYRIVQTGWLHSDWKAPWELFCAQWKLFAANPVGIEP